MYFRRDRYEQLNVSPVDYSIGRDVNEKLGITNEEVDVIVNIPATDSQRRIRELGKLITRKVFERYINLSSISVDAEFITNSVIRDKPEMMNRVVEFGLRGFNDQMLRYQFPIVWDMDYMATLLPENYTNDH